MKKHLAILLNCCIVLAAIFSLPCHGENKNKSVIIADSIYTGGTIVTMDANDTMAEAVAVKGGKIVALGDKDEVMKFSGAGTKINDLKGKTMLPGFYAAHDHFPDAGRAKLFKVDLGSPPMGPIKNMDELIAALKKKAEMLPKGKWVVGRGYDDTLLAEKRHPTRWDLDKASTDHPIYIGHTSGHLGVANSLALKMAKITKETPNPKGGVVCKDPNTGEPTGVFEECGGKVGKLIPGLTKEQQQEAIEWCSKHYISKGVTTTVIAGGSEGSVNALKRALEKGKLDLRIVSMTGAGEAEKARKALKGVDSDRIKVTAIKMFQDGSNQGYTGYFSKPYYTPFKGDANYVGYPQRSKEELAKMVLKAHKAGYQVAIHANGDAAIGDVIYAFVEAQKAYPRPDARHRIEHCQMIREDQLDLAKQYGITPSFFVDHVYYWGDRHRDIFMGPERGARISPLKSAQDRGIRFTTHNDTPVTPVDPLHLVWTSVNRLTTSGKVLGPEQRVSVKQALKAVTIDAAWQNFEENRKGSIEKGKLADFVILSENPLTVKPETIKDIEIAETIVGDKVVYKK